MDFSAQRDALRFLVGQAANIDIELFHFRGLLMVWGTTLSMSIDLYFQRAKVIRKEAHHGPSLWHFRLRIPIPMGPGIRPRLGGEGRSGFSRRQRAEPNRTGKWIEFHSVSQRFRPPGYDLSRSRPGILATRI